MVLNFHIDTCIYIYILIPFFFLPSPPPTPKKIQQSSTDIWHAICAAVKAACSSAEVAPEEVKGLGFAATCSLGIYNF